MPDISTTPSMLNQAGYLAIPIKANANHPLINTACQPNWMVIENIFGRVVATLPQLGETVCQNTAYKLVFREVLPASVEMGRPEEIREVIWEYANQPVPVTIVPALSSYPALQAYAADVNQLLALFQFRGVLAGFALEIDINKLNEYLTPNT